jgi:hypothetical protein
VKAAITAGLRRRGIDVATAQEDGGARLEDDLLGVARARQTAGVFFAGLIDGHPLAATVGKDGLDLAVVCQV